jgi:hypothetical protein
MTAGALMAATLALQGCDSATPVMDDFIVDINNLWHVDTDSNHTFFFKPSTVGAVAAASFTGNEEFAGKESNLSGSFNREQISFTVVRSSGSVLFSGTFSDANTMDLTSNGSSIRLKRG